VAPPQTLIGKLQRNQSHALSHMCNTTLT